MTTTSALSVSALLVTACGGAEKKPDPKPTQKEVKKEEKKLTPEEALAATIGDANKLLDSKKYPEALAKYDAALAKDPKNADARLGKARSQIALAKLDDAEVTIDGLLKDSPDDRSLKLLLGDVYREKKDFDKGIDLYKGMLKADENDPEALNNLIVLYRAAGSYDKAHAASTKLLSRDPDNVTALTNLSLVYYEQEKFPLSKVIAARSLKLDDKDARLYNNQGMIEVKKGNLLEAIPFFKKAIEFDKSLADPHLNIGSIALRYRDYDTAATHYGEAVKLQPRHAEGNLGYGYALAGQQKGKEAIAQLERAIEIAGKEIPGAIQEGAFVQKRQLNDNKTALVWAKRYEKAVGTVKDDDPMKVFTENLVNELEAEQMAAESEEEAAGAEGAAEGGDAAEGGAAEGGETPPAS